MTRFIRDTPELVGKQAEDFLNSLNKPLTEKEKKLFEEINSQRRVYLWDEGPKE